jgi:hypothetical protein
VEAASRAQAVLAGPTYVRRQPEKSALYRVMQYLLTFEQQRQGWRPVPKLDLMKSP